MSGALGHGSGQLSPDDRLAELGFQRWLERGGRAGDGGRHAGCNWRITGELVLIRTVISLGSLESAS